MSIAALFVIVKSEDHLNTYFLMKESTKCVYPLNRIFSNKKDKILIHATIRKNLENIRERSQM